METDFVDPGPSHLSTYAGYNILRPKTEARKTRVLFLQQPSQNYQIQIRNDLMSSDLTSMWVDVTPNNNESSFTIGAFYREWNPWNSRQTVENQRERLRNFFSQVERATVKGRDVVLCGDFNLDMEKRFDSTYQLKSLWEIMDTGF